MLSFDKLLSYISRTPRLLIAWICVVLFYARHVFTNQSTPGGDGIRVLGYAESARASDYFLPLWNPFPAGGLPSLADPEWLFYRLISPVLNLLPSEFYNLNFNLVILSALLILTTAVYYTACSLNTTRLLAAMAAVLFVCSGLGWESFEKGRINSIIILSSGLFLLPLYKGWLYNQSNRLFLLIIIASVIHILFSSHYALITYGLFFAYAIGCNITKTDNRIEAIFASTKHLIFISITSLFLGAAFLIPLLDLQLNSLTSTEVEKAAFHSVPISYLYNIFIPSKQSNFFPYISFLLLPCLISMLFFRKIFSSPEVKSLMIIGFIYLAIGTGFGLPSDTFNRYYNSIPIINLIRWGFVYTQFTSLALILVCFAAISSITSHPLERKIKWILIISIAIHLVSPKDFFFKGGAANMAPRTTNIAAWPELTQTTMTNSPRIGRLRQYCPKSFSCPLNGAPNIPGVIGFSLYFSNESRLLQEMLINKKISAQRPHWVGRRHCSKLNETALEMASVRYIFCRGKKQRPNSTSWSLVGYSASNQFNFKNKTQTMSLWENPKVNSPAKLFYSQSRKTSQNLSQEKLKVLWESDVIALDTTPNNDSALVSKHNTDQIQIERWDEENIVITTSNKTDAILFISALYDKGWQAILNDHTTSLHRAFRVFQAIKLPAGKNHLQLQYKPKSWLLGKIISIVTMLLLCVFFLIKKDPLPENDLLKN